MPWPLIIAVGAVALLAPLVGVIIHVIALVLTFTGIAALAAGGGWVWWRLAHRRPRQLVYRPQMQVQPRWGRAWAAAGPAAGDRAARRARTSTTTGRPV